MKYRKHLIVAGAPVVNIQRNFSLDFAKKIVLTLQQERWIPLSVCLLACLPFFFPYFLFLFFFSLLVYFQLIAKVLLPQ